MKRSIIISIIFLWITGCSVKKNTPVSNKEKSIFSTYKNIKIYQSNSMFEYACEPSIAINPANINNLVAGNVLKGVHYSFDGGKTWTGGTLESSRGVYGDPCIAAGNNGVFYYLHLANPDGDTYGENFLNQIVLQKSLDGGKTWNDGTGIGISDNTQQDKHWVALDSTGNEVYVTWTEFDKYGSKNPADKSRILFSRSQNGGDSFSTPIRINDVEGDCLDDDYTTEGAVPAVDKQGNIYVCWGFDNHIYFDLSTDGGKTWGKDRIIANQPGGWAQDIPGLSRCNGMPVTAVDNSNGKFAGRIYVNWTDQRNGIDNTDVFFIYSDDKGENWSEPLRVNADNSISHQFLTWMDVDPVTGYVYIIYYDRSRYKDNRTDVCIAVSKDGGATFQTQIISESPFTPVKEIFFGDYNNIDAYNGIIRPIWTRYENYRLSIWTALLEMEEQ
jgi:hypothetical protein